MGLEAVGEGLFDEGVAVSEEKNVLGLVGAKENNDKSHGGAGFTGAGSHDEERAALVRCKGFGNSADGFVLIGAVDDGAINESRSKGEKVLADEFQAFKVG